MQESPIVRVHLDNRSEDRYTSIQLSETSTAEEVCKSAVLKLVGSVQSTQSADLKDYGLFVRTRSAEMKMKERKFAAFELPAVILKGAPIGLEMRFCVKNLSSLHSSPQTDQSPPSFPAFSVPVKEGPLKLRGKRRFKERYFVLAHTHMLYAHSQKTISQLSAVISLEDLSVSVTSPQPVNETTFGKFTFELITPVRIFILKSESNDEKAKWMRAINDQISALSDAKAFKLLNEAVRTAEEERADRDVQLIEKCSDFKDLMSLKESSFLPLKKRELIMLMEEYRHTASTGDVPKALAMAQKLVDSLDQPTPLLSASLLPEKLALFFHFLDHSADRSSTVHIDTERMEELFAEVEQEVVREVREVECPRVLGSEEFKRGVLRLPARRLLTPWEGRRDREGKGRKSRSFFLSESR